jgi:hypothetical protein
MDMGMLDESTYSIGKLSVLNWNAGSISLL